MSGQIFVIQCPAPFDIDEVLQRAIAAGNRPGELSIDAHRCGVEIALTGKPRVIVGGHRRRHGIGRAPGIGDR